jgi:hypothetical protein
LVLLMFSLLYALVFFMRAIILFAEWIFLCIYLTQSTIKDEASF